MPPGMIFDRDQDWEQGRCCRSRVMSDNAADGVIRNQLPDDTLLVFLSDTHIGGAAGSDIFESAAELILLLEDLNRHQGPVELVLAGDFLDVLRMLYDALGLESAQLAVAVAGLAGVVVIIASSVPMWNEILRYARGEPVGTDRSGRASRTDRSR